MGDRVRLRNTLPYGIWTRQNGEQVLFNRDYRAIWRRMPRHAAVAVPYSNPKVWITEIVSEEWWYSTRPPWLNKRTRTLCEQVLGAFISGGKLP